MLVTLAEKEQIMDRGRDTTDLNHCQPVVKKNYTGRAKSRFTVESWLYIQLPACYKSSETLFLFLQRT